MEVTFSSLYLTTYSDALIDFPSNVQDIQRRATNYTDKTFVWVLTKPLICSVDGEVTKENIILPELTVTDFASTPRSLWAVYPPWGLYGKAAVLHDYLYQIGYKNSRELCDKLFLHGMISLGVDAHDCNAIYSAVRLGGRLAWGKHRKNEAALLAT